MKYQLAFVALLALLTWAQMGLSAKHGAATWVTFAGDDAGSCVWFTEVQRRHAGNRVLVHALAG